MIFQILDRQFNTLATMDNSLTGAIHFFDDEFHQYLNEGMSTLEFSVLRDHADVEYLVEGNYIQFTYKSRDYLMTIRRIEEDEWQLNISTEDLSFDLINEHAPAYTAPAARKITDYLKDILADSDVVIGLNEVSNYTRKLEWTGESTVLERVLSIMAKFDAECEFITELNNDRSLKQITLNIYHKYDDTHQGVGVNRSDIELRLGENVKTVQKTIDITELYTSIKPVGNDGLSIKNIEETITDDGGNVLYYTKKGSEYIFAPVANARFGRKNAEKGGYINMPYEFDTDSVATLYGNALSQLKKYSEPAVTYEVDGYYDLDIGDVVSIADNRYSPILLLEARAAEMIISFSNPENNKTIFSNYRVFDSQISSDLLKLMEQMKSDVDYAVQVANTPIFNITSKGSTAFKNGEGSVELTASIERANTDVTNEYTIFNWVKQNKDGSNDTEWTEAHKNQGKSITITPDDFVDTATFHYETEKDSKLYVGGSATVVKVYDGEDGKTPIKGVDYFDGEDGTNGLSAYLHIRYSQNSNGNPMTSDPTGAKYVGMQASQNPNPSTVPADYDWTLVKGSDGKPGSAGVSVSSVVEEYYVSTSPTSQAGGSWSTTVPNNADPNKYVFRRMKTTMSNGTITYTNPALISGMTGIYPYIGPTQPANPKEGQQWWKSDSSGNVTNFYVYKSGSWQGQTIQQSVLNIIALNAVTITGSTITGTTINGSEFNTSYTKMFLNGSIGSYVSGTQKISNGNYTASGKLDDTFPFETKISPVDINSVVRETDNFTVRKQYFLSGDGLNLVDRPGNFTGTLNASALTKTPWINISYRTGYSTAEGNPCQYRIVYQLDGTRKVYFRGQFKRDTTMVAGADQHPFDMPAGTRPATTIMGYGPTNTGQGSRPYVTNTGYFGTLIGAAAATYVEISNISYEID